MILTLFMALLLLAKDWSSFVALAAVLLLVSCFSAVGNGGTVGLFVACALKSTATADLVCAAAVAVIEEGWRTIFRLCYCLLLSVGCAAGSIFVVGVGAIGSFGGSFFSLNGTLPTLACYTAFFFCCRLLLLVCGVGLLVVGEADASATLTTVALCDRVAASRLSSARGNPRSRATSNGVSNEGLNISEVRRRRHSNGNDVLF